METAEKLKKYFSVQGDVLSAYIFGSFAKGKENQYSDLDVAILLDVKTSQKDYADRRVAMMCGLSSALNIDLDIVILNNAGPFLKFEVYRHGKVVYEKEMAKSRSFKARSILEYFDFLPIKNMLEARLIRRIKEA